MLKPRCDFVSWDLEATLRGEKKNTERNICFYYSTFWRLVTEADLEQDWFRRIGKKGCDEISESKVQPRHSSAMSACMKRKPALGSRVSGHKGDMMRITLSRTLQYYCFSFFQKRPLLSSCIILSTS
jgi:hypothetical protein